MKSKDINSQKFEKAAFGYKQEDVDGFLNELAADYSQLEKDNEEINTKLQLLADKVREYRKDEDAVKDALLFAQKEGHRIVSDANAKAEDIITRAKRESEKIISDATMDSKKAIDEIRAELKKEQDNLSYMQKQVSEFKKDLFDMYKSHLELISSMPQIEEEEEEEEEETVAVPEVKKAPVSSTSPLPSQPQPTVQAANPVPSAVPPVQSPAEDQFDKPDPFRTQSMPVIGSGDNKYAELQFGQQNNK